MSSQDTKLNQDEIAEFNEDLSKNFDVLPLFERQYSSFLGIKRYSLNSNEKLRSRWYERLKGGPAGAGVAMSMPKINDYHFHNCRTKFLPSESRANFKHIGMHLTPGPGVDRYGQRPIPDDMISKRIKPARPTTGKNKKKTAKADRHEFDKTK